jgi:hypothetical protein
MRHISDEPQVDRDQLLRGIKLRPANADELRKLPLRNLFIQEKDIDIATIIWNYFDAIRQTWPSAWNFGGRGIVLNKSSGFRAFMRVFKTMYLDLGTPGDVVTAKDFRNRFSRTHTQDDYFTIENFPPGSTGESLLTRHLLSDLGLDR